MKDSNSAGSQTTPKDWVLKNGVSMKKRGSRLFLIMSRKIKVKMQIKGSLAKHRLQHKHFWKARNKTFSYRKNSLDLL